MKTVMVTILIRGIKLVKSVSKNVPKQFRKLCNYERTGL